jgi:spore coat protein CotF
MITEIGVYNSKIIDQEMYCFIPYSLSKQYTSFNDNHSNVFYVEWRFQIKFITYKYGTMM